MGRKRKQPDSPGSIEAPASVPEPVVIEPPAKRRKCVDPSELFHDIYETLRHYKDINGRLLCEHLVRVPKRRNLPEYYDKVQQPIDLLKIQQRLKTDEYRTLDMFTSDIQLLLSNAQLFYPTDSQEYKDSDTLLDLFWSTCQRLFPGGGAPPSGGSFLLKSPVPGSAGAKASATASAKAATPISAKAATPLSARQAAVAASRAESSSSNSPLLAGTPSAKRLAPVALKGPQQKDHVSLLSPSASLLDVCQAIMDEVLSLEDNGRSVCDIFMKLPARSQYPEYYRVITEPIDIKMILTNIKSKDYMLFSDFRMDLTIMVKNAQHFNEPSSQVYKDATLIGKTVDASVKKLSSSHGSIINSRPSLKVTLRAPAQQPKAAPQTQQAKSPVSPAASTAAQAAIPVTTPAAVAAVATAAIASCPSPVKPSPISPASKPVLAASPAPVATAASASSSSVGAASSVGVISMTSTVGPSTSSAIHTSPAIAAITPSRPVRTATPASTSSIGTGNSSNSSVGSKSATTGVPPVIKFLEDEWESSSDESTAPGKSSSPSLSGNVSWDRVPPHRKHWCPLYEAVANATDNNGRELSKEFMRLPSSRYNPEYYAIVPNPMSLARIKRHIQLNRYSNLDEIVADLELTFCNAQQIHPPTTRQYQDASRLLEIMRKTAAEISAGGAGSKEEVSPSQDGSKMSVRKSVSTLHTVSSIGAAAATVTGVLPTSPVRTSPLSATAGPQPSASLSALLSPSAASSSAALACSVTGASTINSTSTAIASSSSSSTLGSTGAAPSSAAGAGAGVGVGASVGGGGVALLTSPSSASTAAATSPTVTTPQPSLPPVRRELTLAQRMIKLHDSIVSAKDSAGQLKSELLHVLPDVESNPAYYRMISNPIDLRMIRTKMTASKYKSLSEAGQDYELLFSNTRQFYPEGSYLHSIASDLESILRRHVPRTSSLAAQRSSSAGSNSSSSASEATVAAAKAVAAARQQQFAEQWAPRKPSDHTVRFAELFQCQKSVRAGFALHVLRGKSYASAHDLACYLGVWPPLDLFRLYPQLTRIVVTDFQEKKLLEAQSVKPCDGFLIVLVPSQVEAIVVNSARYKDGLPHGSNSTGSSSNSSSNSSSSSVTAQRPYPATTVSAPTQSQTTSSSATSSSANAQASAGHVHLQRRPSGKPAGTSTPATSTADIDLECQTTLIDTVYKYTDSGGRLLIAPFMELPSASEYPNYYNVIKKPMDMKTIRAKRDAFQYTSMEDVCDDILLLFSNACKYNEPASQIFKDAVILQNALIHKRSVLQKEKVGRARAFGAYPDVPLLVRQLLSRLFKSVLQFEDDTGRCLSQHLCQLPGNNSSTQGKDTGKGLDMSGIKRLMNEGEYLRLDTLQADVFAAFDTVREQCGPASQHWNDSVQLQRVFIEKRDELCGQGQLLDSPAFSFGLPNLEARVARIRQECANAAKRAPAVSQSSSAPRAGGQESLSAPAPSGEEQMEVEETSAKIGDSEQTGAADSKEDGEAGDDSKYIPTESITIGSEKYARGDFVYVRARDDQMDNHVVAIERWQKSTDSADDTVEFFGNYFYRPPETFHVPTRKFLEQEIFKSDYYAPFPATDIVGRCCVVFCKDYFKMVPSGLAEEDVFVCESRYMTKAKSFKKIKIWPFTTGRFKLKMRAHPLQARRVESVFAQHAATSSSSAALMAAKTDNVESSEAGDASSTMGSMQATVVSTQVDDQPFVVPSTHNVVKVTESTDTPPGEDGTGCTYYEQFVFESCTFKLGDNVYLRSDQADPFVARIDRIWTDKDGHPYFHGPWFVRPSEVEHSPSRMFYKRELLMSSLHDSNSMKSIQGRCAVLDMQTYTKGRMTEVNETDVYVCESRYNESDRQIRRLKGLKVFQLSSVVLSDEWYYFGEDIAPLKVPSPKIVDETDGVNAGSASNIAAAGSGVSSVPYRAAPSTPVTASPLPRKPIAIAPSSMPKSSRSALGSVSAYLLFAGEVSLKLRNTQPSIAADELNRLVEAEWHQLSETQRTEYDVKASSLSHSSVFASPQPNMVVYECLWEGCGHQYEGEPDFLSHMTNTYEGSHLYSSSHLGTPGEYPCKWTTCQRFKRNAPFLSHYKLSKHIRENHHGHGRRMITIAQRSPNYFPRSVTVSKSAATGVASAASLAASPLATPVTASMPGQAALALAGAATSAAAAAPAVNGATAAGSNPTGSAAQQTAATTPAAQLPGASTSNAGTAAAPTQAASSTAAAAAAGTASNTSASAQASSVPAAESEEERSRKLHTALYSSYVASVQTPSDTLSQWSNVTNNENLPATLTLQQLPVAWLPTEISKRSPAVPQAQQNQTILKSLLTLRQLMLRDAATLSDWSTDTN